MAKVNKAWHSKNKMPKHATTQQRIKWHLAHAKECGCREMPNKIKALT
jgi:hypothetical protein